MDSLVSPRRSYDPELHDSHVIALFQDEAAAGQARAALLAAGVPAAQVAIMADGAALHAGARHPVQDLFVPEDDYHDYHHALVRGNSLLIVQPTSAATRDVAVAVLEQCQPLDLAEHGRHWRGTASLPVERMAVNRAILSRADMAGRALGGRDEVILDMTGQKMTVRTMSDTEMAEAPFAPIATPAHRPVPLAPPAPPRERPVQGTSYTYGVPPEIVQRMSPEEQVTAQVPARDSFLRVVDGQTRIGWREAHHAAGRVRSYVTERPTDSIQ